MLVYRLKFFYKIVRQRYENAHNVYKIMLFKWAYFSYKRKIERSYRAYEVIKDTKADWFKKGNKVRLDNAIYSP